ncbi:hypothetical protein [Nonomuraea sp. NPDC049695]|uniref:hypothetical protein n=1 Tax=Nonomuraea sp. NPDC049695 TaxID=3154734 RepID=UPI003440A468
MVAACDLATPLGRRDRLPLVLGLALMGRRSELVEMCEQSAEQKISGGPRTMPRAGSRCWGCHR